MEIRRTSLLDASMVRAAQSEELKTALAFARLEIAELQAGIRGLTACPGIENIAKLITQAKGR